MATYTELEGLRNDTALFGKVRVATWIAAEIIRNEAPATPNNVNRLLWAKAVFEGEEGKARQMFWAVLAANKDVALAAITGATDVAIQTAVDAAVDLFAV